MKRTLLLLSVILFLSIGTADMALAATATALIENQSDHAIKIQGFSSMRDAQFEGKPVLFSGKIASGQSQQFTTPSRIGALMIIPDKKGILGSITKFFTESKPIEVTVPLNARKTFVYKQLDDEDGFGLFEKSR
jgi:hypothetical protein